MSNQNPKSAGRPKAKPSELCLRRIGKHFEAADQLLATFQNAKAELRDSGYGKQPFNSYVKSLQERVAMYNAYLELLSIYADDAGYEINTDTTLSDEDKERPWNKLKEHFRDKDDQKLSLKDELKERRKVFDGSQRAYNKSYPYIEWSGFWFEAEINAAQRLASQAIMSFDLMGVNYLTLDQCLSTAEAKKGRDTFINKKGKNVRDEFALQHSNIIRHKNRLRKAAEALELDSENVDKDTFSDLVASLDKVVAKKAKQAERLALKIEKMESELEQKLKSSPKEAQIKFQITLAKKERLPLVKLQNGNKITPIQRVQLANIEKKIDTLKEDLERLSDTTEKQVV